jgi:hypothetical protein
MPTVVMKVAGLVLDRFERSGNRNLPRSFFERKKQDEKSKLEEGDNSCDHVIIRKLTKNNIRNKRERCCLNKKRKSSEDAEEIEDGSEIFELRRLFARNYEMIVISIISKHKFSSRSRYSMVLIHSIPRLWRERLAAHAIPYLHLFWRRLVKNFPIYQQMI